MVRPITSKYNPIASHAFIAIRYRLYEGDMNLFLVCFEAKFVLLHDRIHLVVLF
jgi:hypothetical protein